MNSKKIVYILCAIAAIVVIAFVLIEVVGKQQRGEVYEDLQESMESTELEETVASVEESEESVVEEVETEEYQHSYENTIDFESLWEINEDIYAWVEVPGTSISYPIVQHTSDDAYYLDYTIENVNGLPGSIYSEPTYNSKDFRDYNTVVYGHEMKDGSMFGTLKLFKNADFREEYNEIVIYTPENTYVYEIYAAVVYDDRHIRWMYDEGDDADSLDFLGSLENTNDLSNYINEELEVTEDDHLITLSTCVANKDNNRYIVVGVAKNIPKSISN